MLVAWVSVFWPTCEPPESWLFLATLSIFWLPDTAVWPPPWVGVCPLLPELTATFAAFAPVALLLACKPSTDTVPPLILAAFWPENAVLTEAPVLEVACLFPV